MQGSSIGEYEITIEDDFGFEETKTVYCKSDTCKCIQELTTNSHSYAIHLSSINAEGINGPETISFTSEYRNIMWAYCNQLNMSI